MSDKSMDELFSHLGSDHFKRRCRVVRQMLDAGLDMEPEEIARHLGIPTNFLMTAAAAWLATETGASVVIAPAPQPPPDKDKMN